jgi:glycosyltransferase involved in cell wall biosynthesis
MTQLATLHILLVTHYYPPNGGEAANRFYDLAHFLHRAGHRVTVLTTMPHYPKGRIADEYRGKFSLVRDDEGVSVVHTWLWATPSNRISRKLISQVSFMLTAMLRGLALPHPDVIFIEAQPIFTGIAGRFLSVVKRAPYGENVSDLWPDHLLSVGALQESSPIYKIARWVMDTGYRGASAITSMSPAWTRRLVAYTGGQTTKLHTILRGTDLTRFRPHLDTSAFRAKHNLGNQKIVSFIGTFATQYDFELQLNVAKSFKHRTDVLFVFIGTGSQKDMVLAHAKDLPNVRLIEWVEYAEMPLAWNISTLNFWALRPEPLYEGTIPAKLFEAFACGIPVVAAQKGEAADIIRQAQGGLVVSTDDQDSLAQAIERMIDDESLRQSCAQNARAYAEQHFNYLDALAQSERVITGMAD